MYKYYLISLALMQAFALSIGEEEDSGVPQCTDDEPAAWLPEDSTGFENPETENTCNSDDEDNGFRNCDCVPPRLVRWDTDANMKTDITALGVD